MTVRLAELLAVWFGCGYAPVAPGTFGSLGAIVPAYLLWNYAGRPGWWFAIAGVLLFPLAVWASDVTAKAKSRKDPGLVVIDEVVGQWIAMAGMTSYSWKSWILAFALFRIFDIWKPWPARRFEAFPGGLGIVADDAMAGVYAALVLLAAGWFNLL